MSFTAIAKLQSAAEISIHAPHARSDLAIVYAAAQAIGFLSTLPVWGATAKPQ